jgi:hypothetical protein
MSAVNWSAGLFVLLSNENGNSEDGAQRHGGHFSRAMQGSVSGDVEWHDITHFVRLTVRIRTAMSGTNPWTSPLPASRKPPSRTCDPHANGGPKEMSLILRRNTWLLNLCMAALRA